MPDDQIHHVLSPSTLDRLIARPVVTVEELEKKFAERQIATVAKVTRIAPSPTGMMHIGGVYAALISERIAHQSEGVFYLRIEDTDKKREQEGAKDLIVRSLQFFGIDFDEGVLLGGNETGQYGPYVQSNRRDIYTTYIRHMLERGLAYPCFMTPDESAVMNDRQNEQKVRPGYYGQWAAWRDRRESDVIAALNDGKEFVIRYRSPGDGNKTMRFVDLIRGTREFPENDNDIVILKRDGLPTYHLAHVIDDHLMRTTTVVRGDEWLPSVALHVQLAQSLSFQPFEYAHIAPIQKNDGTIRRKLSKRKDPEANVEYYIEQGYPPVAVVEYLLNQANSNFEDWRRNNPDVDCRQFPLVIDKLPRHGGALLNLGKLDDVSQNYLGRLSVADLYEHILLWTRAFDPDFAIMLQTQPEYAKKVLSVERGQNNTRKDLIKLSQTKDIYGFFFDDLYGHSGGEILSQELITKIDRTDIRSILKLFMGSYDENDTQDIWFDKIKKIGNDLGYTSQMKEYRKNPDTFKGSVADVAMVLRVCLTARNRSPNLYEVMKIMGRDRVFIRLNNVYDTLCKLIARQVKQ